MFCEQAKNVNKANGLYKVRFNTLYTLLALVRIIKFKN